MRAQIKLSLILLVSLNLQACIGSIIGATADVAIEVVKIPFKVGGAVVDAIKGDELTDLSPQIQSSRGNEAHSIENQGLH